MRFRLNIASKAKRLFISSPAKEKALNGGNPVAEFGYKSKQVDSSFGLRSPDFGSKEEIFFDSRAWLDSDCEDDFFSVNGDFTPSRGSTPNHQISKPMTPQLNRAHFVDIFPDPKSEPSPTDRKKKLSELLQDNLQGEADNEQNDVAGKVKINGKPDFYKLDTDRPSRSLDGTPSLSGANSVYGNEVTPDKIAKHNKEKTGKTKHCCLPSLVLSCGSSDRRKQRQALNAESYQEDHHHIGHI